MTETDDVFSAFLGSSAPDGWLLEFQQALFEDEEDTYCVVLDPGQRVSYGGVREVALASDVLTISFTAKAAADLEIPERIRVAVTAGSEAVDALVLGLVRVLRFGREEEHPKLTLPARP